MANILIVDDSKTSRKILRNILESDNHTIVGEATNGEDGITKYKELKPDLVTMDITMPILDGIDALKGITEFDSEAKVVMVTAAGQKSKMVEAVKYGAREFISKPFDPNYIMNVITKVLNGDE